MKTMNLKQNGIDVEVIVPDKTQYKLYMHTIEGHPAIFDGEQIVYSNREISLSDMKVSLIKIRQEQKRSKKFRKNLIHTATYEEPYFGYGHTIVYLK